MDAYEINTTVNDLCGDFFILPSNSASRIKAVAASPLVFSPEKPELDRPKTEVFVSIATALSPKVFVSVDVYSEKGDFVRRIAEDTPLALVFNANGEWDSIVPPEVCDPRIQAGPQKLYHYFTSGAPKVAEWDGKDGNQNYVASGVYKLEIRVADGVGNISTDETVVGEAFKPLARAKPAGAGSIILAKRGNP